jgi:hypothetical protein
MFAKVALMKFFTSRRWAAPCWAASASAGFVMTKSLMYVPVSRDMREGP